MKVLIAIDSMKGSIGSMAGGRAVAAGVKRVFPEAECVVRPLADGGEGTVAALTAGMGGEIREVVVTGPLGRPVRAKYGIVGELAVMEMAEAAGITLIGRDELDAAAATTYGVGEMILDALNRGCRRFIVGIGGSATNDGGAGMLQAVGFRLTDAEGRELAHGGAALRNLARIEDCRGDLLKSLPPGSFRIACDVVNPLCGENGASAVYGPQKGASPETVRELDAALGHFADVAGGDAGYPGAGAAGGLGFALRTFFGGELKRGVDLVLEETRFAEAAAGADIVVTGEGRLDAQTSMGKAPIGVAKAAKRFGKAVVAFCGCLGEGAGAVNGCGIDAYFPILRRVATLEEALDPGNAAANLADTAEQAFRLLKTAGWK
jgi:glycerate kinase